MTASRAKSFAPPNALTIWRDAKYIFAEIPGPGEETTILSFAFSQGGLGKVLALLGNPPDVSGPPLNYIPPRPIKRVGTLNQHNLAESILRKKGILK
jgi:hypothetical protein